MTVNCSIFPVFDMTVLCRFKSLPDGSGGDKVGPEKTNELSLYASGITFIFSSHSITIHIYRVP